MLQSNFRFDEFQLDTENNELLRAGHRLKLERIPMQLLTLLVENSGKLVRRETIVERLWGGNIFVESEHSINTAVNKLRATLRDDPKNPRFIKTMIGQGYCFIASVSMPESAKTEPTSGASGLGDPEGDIDAGTPDIHIASANGHSTGTSNQENYAQGEPAASDEVSTAAVTELPPREAAAATPRKFFDRKGWIIAGLAGCIAVLIALTVYLLRQHEKIAQSRQEAIPLHSVAVLPFRNLAQTTAQDYLVDGITDELTTNLARSTSLRVISQRSAMQYKGVEQSIQEVARALNVDAVVEGSYLRADKRVRITAQLLDARSDRHLWAQMYDESDKDLLAMQDRVTQDIAQQVAIVLGTGFIRSKLRVVNPLARDAYLRGRYFWNQRTPSTVTTSVRYFTEAIRQDPDYAEAYAALAEAYVLLDTDDDLWKAQYAAERALDLNSSLGEAHAALGAVKIERDWDWTGAEEEYRRALQLSPADPTVHHWHSLHLSRMGKLNEAEVEIQNALALDPLSLIINTDAAETAYWMRDPKKALTRVEGVLALSPDFAGARVTKGEILEQLSEYEQAEEEFDTGKKLIGGAEFLDAFRAHAMALGGKTEEALKLVKQLESAWPKNHVSGAYIGLAYCGLRRPDDAMKWFEAAYQRHQKGMGMLAIDPVYDGCRSDPRFTDLVRRLRLVQ